jgi:glutamate/tyrosine decarboxylase-like PLP-dependent enzyme
MTDSSPPADSSPYAPLADVVRRARHYLETIGDRRAYPDDAAIAGLRNLDVPLQDEPMPPAAIVEELDRWATPAATAIAGPRYFGFVNGGALPGALAASWLATSWEQNGAFQVMSPGSHFLEHVASKWVLDLLGLPADCAVGFVTGTTAGDIACLAAARDSVLASVGWDVAEQGLFGAPPVTVIVGDEGHSTLFKALQVVGLGRNRVVEVQSDSQGRMRAGAMPRITGPTIVCAQAGNVNSGSFDPLREIAERTREAAAPAWMHVDGAFGVWARCAPARAHLCDGLELADSWATDGHKWLNTTYDCGIAIVRDGAALGRTLTIKAEYLPVGIRDGSDTTLEGSRRPRGVEAWAALRSLGRRGLADMVERHCRQARRFADAFAAAGFPVLNDVVLNQVLVSFGDDRRTRAVIAAIQEDGTCWCGPTVWRGTTAMRVSVIGWMTTDADVDRSIEAILRIARS